MDEAEQRRVIAASRLRALRRALTAAPLRSRVYGDEMTLAQADAVDQLMDREAMRIGQLAEALRVDASTMTRTVDGLVSEGLARRIDVADDGRGVLVALTEEGRRRYAKITERRIEAMRELLADFTVEEEVALVQALDRLVQALDGAGVQRSDASVDSA